MVRQLDDPSTALNDAAHRNSKRTGELSEAAFLHKAVGLGFRVTKPWGDSERYDFVLDSGKRLWRVQIKCTAVERAGGYHIQPIHFVYGKNKVVYTAEDIDVLAAHVVPLDVWYVVPVAALAQGRSLRLYPDDGCKTARFEKYREGWDFFRGGEGRGGEEQIAAIGMEAGTTAGDEDPEDESIPLCFTRLAFVWKPRFFGR